MQDLIAIITSFSARLYGQRRVKRKTEKIITPLLGRLRGCMLQAISSITVCLQLVSPAWSIPPSELSFFYKDNF